MAVTIYQLDATPTLTVKMLTGDSVTVAMYDRMTGASVALDSNTATENIAGSGTYDYTLDFTTKPSYGKNAYKAKFTGTLQITWVEFDWNDDRGKYDGRVIIDTSSGNSGQYYPNGTAFQAVDNLTDALAIATNYGFSLLEIKSSITLDQSIAGYTVQGARAKQLDVINLNGQDVSGCSFIEITLAGAMNAASICFALDCWLSNVTNINCYAERAAILGTLTIMAGGQFLAQNIVTQSPLPVSISCSDVGGVALADFIGRVTFSDVNHAFAFVVVTGTFTATLESTCANGNYFFGGIGTLTDNSTGGTLTQVIYPTACLEQNITGYTTTGTHGDAINDLTANLGLVKTESDKIPKILGLSQENFRMYNQVYDSNGNLTSASVRTYPTAADCNNDTNQLATYTITVTWSGGECTAYKVVLA